MLCTALTSLSSGFAVLIIPVVESMLKKRSRSVLRSIEYLQTKNHTDLKYWQNVVIAV